jgi:hypothetical protein
MASVEVVVNNGSRHSERIPCISEEKLCANCLTMKDYVQVLTTELKSAQLIIKILQDELKSNTLEPTTTENSPTCVNSIEWKLVSTNKYRINRITPIQKSQLQSIPTILNRYTIPDNLNFHSQTINSVNMLIPYFPPKK